MTRRQREGFGGRQYRCGQPGCPLCSNSRQRDGMTKQELVAELEQREQSDDRGPSPESVERCPTCGTEGCA